MFETYSHTQRKLFALCQRKYEYAYVHGLRSLDPVGIEGRFSRDVIHPAMQAVHEAREYDDVVRRAKELWEQFASSLSFAERANAGNCSEKVVGKAIQQYWPMVQRDRAEGWECQGVEVRMPHRTLKYGESTYVTRVDVVEGRGEELLPVEIKFSGRQQEIPWELDNQLLGHAECFDTKQVQLVQVLAPKKSKSSEVTVMRTVVRFASDQLREWRLETHADMMQLDAAWATGVWGKRNESCFAFGKACPYLQLCQAGALRRALIADWQSELNTDGGRNVKAE